MSATRFFTRWYDGTKIFALNPKLEKQNFSLLRRYGSESNFWVGPYYSFCPGILELEVDANGTHSLASFSGYFPLPGTCSRFLRCRKSRKDGRFIGFRGFVFRCPLGFYYSGERYLIFTLHNPLLQGAYISSHVHHSTNGFMHFKFNNF